VLLVFFTKNSIACERTLKIAYVQDTLVQDIQQNTGCFSFFSGMSVLTLALCARLSWLLVSFKVHIKSLLIIIINNTRFLPRINSTNRQRQVWFIPLAD